MQRENNKGQIAVWVIIAMVIVAAIGAIFLLSDNGIIIKPDSADPRALVEQCARTAVQEAVDIMLPQGGFIEPENYKVYNGIKVAYLCQNLGYFRTCINQHPLFLSEMREEILNYTKPRVEQCFQTMKTEYEKRNYEVDMKDMQINLSYGTGKVFLDMQRKITLSKQGETRNFESFNVEMANPIYDIGKVAQQIADQESKYCYFEYVGYILLYPKYSISKFAFSDSTKIYTIKDIQSKKEMNIAIRSCAIPPGL